MESGKAHLLTTGNPAKRIIAFALPILATEVLHIFYTMADAFVVGRWLGINGLAAVGATYNLICFVWGFIFGLTGGFTVITTQRIGAGDSDGIRRSIAAGFLLCFATAVIFTFILVPLIPYIITLMQTPGEIAKDAQSYVTVLFSGMIILLFSNMLASIIYAAGDSITPLIFNMLGLFLNLILNIIFITALSWGITGVAIATVISQFIAGLLTFIFLLRRFRPFLPRRQDWRVSRHELKTHLSLGFAMGLQRSIVEVGNILVQAAINGFGALTIAAVSAAQRVRGLNMMPLFALSRALTTFTAQNHGAGNKDRVLKGLLQGSLISIGLGVFMAALNQFTGRPIVSLFLRESPEAITLATQYLLITGYTVFILGIMLVFRSALQGMGKKTAPILSSIMETVMSIFAAFVLIPSLGFLGVCLVNPLSWLASGIPLYIAFAFLRKELKQSELV